MKREYRPDVCRESAVVGSNINAANRQVTAHDRRTDRRETFSDPVPRPAGIDALKWPLIRRCVHSIGFLDIDHQGMNRNILQARFRPACSSVRAFEYAAAETACIQDAWIKRINRKRTYGALGPRVVGSAGSSIDTLRDSQ